MVWWTVGSAVLSAGLAYVFVPRAWHWRHARDDTNESAGAVVVRRPRRAGGRIAVTLEKALDVRVPVREVFGTLGLVEKLPQIIPHLREARKVASGRHHWVMTELASGPIEWDTVITRFGTNQVVAWETPPGSLVRHSGHVTFRANGDGGTRVSIGLAYVLPPGPFGEQVAALLRSAEWDEALRRWKVRIEDGREAMTG